MWLKRSGKRQRGQKPSRNASSATLVVIQREHKDPLDKEISDSNYELKKEESWINVALDETVSSYKRPIHL